MASISDGTTTLTPACPADEKLVPVIDKSERRTASGSIRAQASGERLQIEVKMRLTGAEYQTLLALFTANASGYFYYTPQQTYSVWDGRVTYPITCDITEPQLEWDNRKVYYVNFKVMSLDYIA